MMSPPGYSKISTWRTVLTQPKVKSPRFRTGKTRWRKNDLFSESVSPSHSDVITQIKKEGSGKGRRGVIMTKRHTDRNVYVSCRPKDAKE